MTVRGTPGCVLKVVFHFAMCAGVRLSVWVLAEDRSVNAPGSPPDTTHVGSLRAPLWGSLGSFGCSPFVTIIAHCECVPRFSGAFAGVIWHSKTSSVHLGAECV